MINVVHSPRRVILVACALLLAAFGTSLSCFPAHAAGRTPVIIIPGVAGSTFDTGPGYTFSEASNGHGGSFQHTYGSNENVWVNVLEAALPGDDDYFDTLRLNSDANTPSVPYSNLHVSGIYTSAYSDLIDYLHRQGYVDNVSLFIFAYDWRRDIPAATTANLDALVNQARTAAGTSQVDLVGHSMGGLVARNYVTSSAANAAKVRRMITLGAPYLGSPKFLKALLYGDQFGPTFLGLGLNPDEVKDIVQNMAGGWELLPDRSYYTFYDNSTSGRLSPYREDRDVDGNGHADGVLNYTGLQTFLRNLGKNQTAAAYAQNFHDRVDSLWPSGPRISFIDGSGLATLGQMRDYVGTCSILWYYYACNQRDELTLDGDGTVPYFSATLNDPSRNINLGGNAALHIVNREHGALVQYDHNGFLGSYSGDGPSLTVLGQILNNSVDPLGGATPAVAASRPRLSGYWIAATNGVQLDVYDGAGKHTGRIPDRGQALEQGIANSVADTLGTSQFTYVPAGGQYSLHLTATVSGTTDVKIRALDGDRVSQTAIFLNVRLQAGDHGDIAFNSLNGAPVLHITGTAGSSTILAEMLNTRQSGDQAAPTITLVAPRHAGKGSVVVHWVARDVLSGLALQQAILDPGTGTARLVTNNQRIQLTPGKHVLQVLAEDRAGNTATREVTFTMR